MTRRLAAATLLVLASMGACTALVDTQVGAGLGTSCTVDDECQGSSCIDGICAIHCGDTAGCPGGTVCASGACQLPLHVAFIYPYDLAQDEIGQSIDAGREQAEEDLGYVDSQSDVGFMLSSAATEKAGELVAAGAQVVVSTTSLHADAFADFGAANPDVEVLTYQGTQAGPNVVPFDARTYQAYYLAGIAAARYSISRRIGIIGSTITPPILASINAFALGAQSQGGAPITVELRWLGEPHDTQPKMMGKTRERVFTEQMVAAGCDVIAHTLDNSIPLFAVKDLDDAGASVFAIGANVEDACSAAPVGHCIGSTFFHWGPVLEQILDGLHRQQLQAGTAVLAGITASDTDSPIGFTVGNGLSGGASLAMDLEAVRVSLAGEQGVGSVFDGPIASTGQCEAELGTSPCVPDGARLTDDQLANMCWLVNGIVDSMNAAACVPSSATCAPAGVECPDPDM